MLKVVLVTIILATTDAARILAVFPGIGYSQFLVAEELLAKLASRGHELTVISAFSPKSNISNYKEINVKHIVEIAKGINLFELHDISAFSFIRAFTDIGLQLTEQSLADVKVQELIHSSETFDVVIVENVFNEAHMAMAYNFKAPLITFNSMGPTEWLNNYVGNPHPPSYVPNLFLQCSSHMNLVQRLQNLALNIFFNIYRYVYAYPMHQKLMTKYFPGKPILEEVIYNVSLILTNSHPSVTEPLPLFPNTVEVGGFHITPEQLPNDIKKFLDEARDGAILFSMGTNVRSSNFPPKLKQEVLEALSGFKQRILWKYEDNQLPGKPDNVKIVKWLPQRAVLAHPNIKLFISHCGQIGLIESVYFGVPLVCIPIFIDQKRNAAVSVAHGITYYLSYSNLSKASLYEAVNEVLTNDSYRTKVKNRKEWMRDRPMDPLETAIYWIEFVIKHRGAPHLRSAPAIHLTWIQYFYFDAVFIFLVMSVGVYSIVKLWNLFRNTNLTAHARVNKKRM